MSPGTNWKFTADLAESNRILSYTAMRMSQMSCFDLKHARRLVLPLSFLLLLSATAACSPSLPSPQQSSSTEGSEPHAPVGDLPNMDQLEADQNFTLLTPDDRRAVVLGELWLKHGARLKGTSRVGSLAAFLRAAHTASELLTSDTCSDPFNESCGTLRSIYAQALREVVSEVRLGEWQTPDLAPSRYRLEIATDGVPVDLKIWSFEFAKSPERPPGERRSGIGLDAAGCRSVNNNGARLPIDICSPLTFVLTFNASVTSEHAVATLSVYDSFQREVVQVGGRDLSLAADFGMTWSLLAERAQETPRSRLLCMSSPGDDPATVVAVVDPRSGDGSWRARYASLSVDGSIRSGYGFCLFPYTPATSVTRQSRDLIASIGALSALDTQNALLPVPTEVFFVTEGAQAAQVVTGTLAQLRRQGRVQGASPTKGSLPEVRGVYMIPAPADSHDTIVSARTKLAHRADVLDAPVYPSTEEASSLRGEQHTHQLHTILSDVQKPSHDPISEAASPRPEDGAPLKLSPIY